MIGAQSEAAIYNNTPQRDLNLFIDVYMQYIMYLFP